MRESRSYGTVGGVVRLRAGRPYPGAGEDTTQGVVFPMKTLRLILPFVAVSPAFVLSGCVLSQYQAAPKDTPPAVMLNLTAARPPLEAVLHCVIVYRGPGSWKKEAFWDEYVVSIVNRGQAPLTLEAATLIDFQGVASVPGESPWKLEDESKEWWGKTKLVDTRNLVMLGAGAYGVTAALWSAAWASGLSVVTANTATGIALAGAAVVAAPLYAGIVISKNLNNRVEVLEEFQRRRLPMHTIVPAGGICQGSLFFRISPGPKRLVLRNRAGEQTVEVEIDLTPLKGLHLNLPAAAPQPPANTATPPAPSS